MTSTADITDVTHMKPPLAPVDDKLRKHILLLPFAAYGHVIPLLELGRKLFQYHDVTLVVSRCVSDNIKQRELVSRDDFPVLGIADGYTGFEGLDRDSWVKAGSVLMPAVEEFLRAIPTASESKVDLGKNDKALGVVKPVDFVIGDNFLAPALHVCQERDIPLFFFNTGAASMTLGHLFVSEDYPTIPDGEDDICAFVQLPPPGLFTI